MNCAAVKRMTKAPAPKTWQATRQSYAAISAATRIGTVICPQPVPTLMIADMSPRRRGNQRATVDSVITSCVLKPMPTITPQTRYRCHGALSLDMSMKPAP